MTGKQIRKRSGKVKREIERRFLVRYLPEYVLEGMKNGIFLKIFLKQGYVPDKKGTRLRIECSKLGTSYVRTIKSGKGLVRLEDEKHMRRKFFFNHWYKVKYWFLKTRYLIPYGKCIIELNFFKSINGEEAYYIQAEVEFKSAVGSRKFIPPEWFDREVTDDPRHSSFSIAKNGVPSEEL